MARLLLPLEPTYPRALLSQPRPRPLTIVGECDLNTRALRVAIVGAREADGRSTEDAAALAAVLARAGVIVVSGGALGVDSAAHKGALEAQGVTWVIAPFGVDAMVFPQENQALFARVPNEGGAMVHVPGATAQARGNFKWRNRVMVRLVDAVVVVQAGARSGSLNAAHEALEINKPVWLAPASVATTGFEGSRELAQDRRVRPLFDAGELLDALGLAAPRREAPARRPAPVHIEPSLDGDAMAIWRGLTEARHRDDLVRVTGLSPSRVANVLFELCIEGHVSEGLDGIVRRAR